MHTTQLRAAGILGYSRLDNTSRVLGIQQVYIGNSNSLGNRELLTRTAARQIAEKRYMKADVGCWTTVTPFLAGCPACSIMCSSVAKEGGSHIGLQR